jgi:uncharacterized protein YxjI
MARIRPTPSVDLLARNAFLVKEHVGAFRAANNFDIHDPATGAVVMLCREESLGLLTRLLRFSDYKTRTPFDITLRTPDGAPVLRVKRGVSFWRSTVQVEDGGGTLLGTFRQRMLSIGGAFDVLDPQGVLVCSLKGSWTGWDFRFVSDAGELAHVTKRWSGMGREFFTSADNYMLSISESVPPTSRARALILAAVLCIDMVLKE